MKTVAAAIIGVLVFLRVVNPMRAAMYLQMVPSLGYPFWWLKEQYLDLKAFYYHIGRVD